MGHKTICDVHLGDYGLQIGEVIYGIKKDNLSIDDIDINYLDKIYPYMSKLCKEDESRRSEHANNSKIRINDADSIVVELLENVKK